jgi:hypothetical protein
MDPSRAGGASMKGKDLLIKGPWTFSGSGAGTSSSAREVTSSEDVEVSDMRRLMTFCFAAGATKAEALAMDARKKVAVIFIFNYFFVFFFYLM